MGLRQRFRAFKNWCPQPPNPVSSKLKRYSAPPNYLDKQVRNKWGYLPVAEGCFLIFAAIAILMLELQTNNSNYSNYTVFYKFWIPIISLCLIAGAFSVVIGVAYLRRIRNRWSYASITAGFSLIAIEAYKLAATLEGTYEQFGIGWSDFQQNWAPYFFSGLMAACFLIVLGIILGLKVRNKLGYVTITGGLAVMLVGASILAANLATSLNYYPPNYYFSLQVAWNTSISDFLIVGALIVAVGIVYLARDRNRKLFSASKDISQPISGE
ncbi:MAG: hypothetical protein ABSG33_02200 [Candidatus Bathyarchaeia archaeon]